MEPSPWWSHTNQGTGRVRLVDASPVPGDWTGKTWGLYLGFKNSDARSSGFSVSMPMCAVRRSLSFLASACQTNRRFNFFRWPRGQHLSGSADALLHPALLTTLVYRFGMPGKATRNLHQVQANGQCFFSRRETLPRTDAFQAAQRSFCDDFTMVRKLAESGEASGFYESDGLVWVKMYEDWLETWRNWPRSLATQDRYFSWHEATGLLEVLLVQALPLPLLAVTRYAERVGLAGRAQHRARFDSDRGPPGRLAGLRAATLDLLAFPATRSSRSAGADHERLPTPPTMARSSLCATCRRDFRGPRQIQDRNPIATTWARDFYLHAFV